MRTTTRWSSSPGSGTCEGGAVCDFEEVSVRTDCSADGLACIDGACVDACDTLTCDTPPADTCDGDTLVASNFPAACVDSACTYQTTRIDCTTAGLVCFEGACVDACVGVICDSPPEDACDGEIARDYRDVGACVLGTCEYGSDDFDCGALGWDCVEAECIDPCIGVVCDSIPADTCEGNIARTYTDDEGVCVAGECTYFGGAEDCELIGRVCEDAACVDACVGVVCDAPPRPSARTTSWCRTRLSAPVSSGSASTRPWRPTARPQAASVARAPASTPASA